MSDYVEALVEDMTQRCRDANVAMSHGEMTASAERLVRWGVLRCEDLHHGHGRAQSAARCRQGAWRILREETSLSLHEIGRFSEPDRPYDHSTVLYGIRKSKDWGC